MHQEWRPQYPGLRVSLQAGGYVGINEKGVESLCVLFMPMENKTEYLFIEGVSKSGCAIFSQKRQINCIYWL